MRATHPSDPAPLRAPMRGWRLAPLTLLVALAACSNGAPEVGRGPSQGLSVIDASELNEVMLAVADPSEAVAHFQRTAAARPDDAAARRGLGQALMRAERFEEAAAVWQGLVESGGATEEDRVALAEALIRTGDWDAARAALDSVPPTFETARRYRLEAMVADAREDWSRADAFYEIAAELDAQPAGVLNNWGYSKLARGDHGSAERLFERALASDPDLFTAKNNLVLARGARGHYEVPLVPMTQAERATLLHTLGLAAIKSGDVATGRELLRDALETHPLHFEAAARALAALDSEATAAPEAFAEAFP